MPAQARLHPLDPSPRNTYQYKPFNTKFTNTMPLQYSVLCTFRPGVGRNLPDSIPANLRDVPMSSTLIYGEKDAVLVDTPLTISGGKEVYDWVLASGKNLKYIYITHPHGDHYFGNAALLDRFPGCKAIATKEAVEVMVKEVATERSGSPFWGMLFPNGQIGSDLRVCEALEGDSFELEGEKLVVIPTGHTDTEHTSTLWVPSIGLAVAGDAVYNNVHPYFGENKTKEKRDQWVEALDTIAALRPKFVVGGHKDPEQTDDPKAIEETRRYFQDIERLDGETGSVQELFDAMFKIHGGRLNAGSLWGAANALKG
jgi:glyoxylase-like metal-dependent hydrolase (beta-lactamase superfamily II)